MPLISVAIAVNIAGFIIVSFVRSRTLRPDIKPINRYTKAYIPRTDPAVVSIKRPPISPVKPAVILPSSNPMHTTNTRKISGKTDSILI